MIVALSHGEEKDAVVLGLTAMNMSLLREGQPIHVNLRHIIPDGPELDILPDIDIYIIFAGKDEMSFLLESMIKKGEDKLDGQ